MYRFGEQNAVCRPSAIGQISTDVPLFLLLLLLLFLLLFLLQYDVFCRVFTAPCHLGPSFFLTSALFKARLKAFLQSVHKKKEKWRSQYGAIWSSVDGQSRPHTPLSVLQRTRSHSISSTVSVGLLGRRCLLPIFSLPSSGPPFASPALSGLGAGHGAFAGQAQERLIT